MATWDDVRRLALSLPETSEVSDHGQIHGIGRKVRDKVFVWQRPLGKSDVRALTALGREIPSGEILGARVEHEGAWLVRAPKRVADAYLATHGGEPRDT